MCIRDSTDTDHNSDFNISASGGNYVVRDTTHGQNRFLIDSSGNVDIQRTLDVGAGLNVTGAITATSDFVVPDKLLHSGDTNTAIRFPAADTISFETAGSERLRITSGGQLNVGSNIKLGAAGIVTATAFVPTTQLSHRNILHNGEFKVIQRYGTSFTINSTSDSEFTFDRYYTGNHDNLGDFTVSQEADAPAGFRTSAKIQCTSTITSTSGTIQSFIQQIVEAQNVSHIFNGSGSQPMTLSFYYKSNTTDQRLLWFYTPDSTRHYSALFTPSATIFSASISRPESVSSKIARLGSRVIICKISLRFFSPPENPSFTPRCKYFSSIPTICKFFVKTDLLIIRYLF